MLSFPICILTKSLICCSTLIKKTDVGEGKCNVLTLKVKLCEEMHTYELMLCADLCNAEIVVCDEASLVLIGNRFPGKVSRIVCFTKNSEIQRSAERD